MRWEVGPPKLVGLLKKREKNKTSKGQTIGRVETTGLECVKESNTKKAGPESIPPQKSRLNKKVEVWGKRQASKKSEKKVVFDGKVAGREKKRTTSIEV